MTYNQLVSPTRDRKTLLFALAIALYALFGLLAALMFLASEMFEFLSEISSDFLGRETVTELWNMIGAHGVVRSVACLALAAFVFRPSDRLFFLLTILVFVDLIFSVIIGSNLAVIVISYPVPIDSLISGKSAIQTLSALLSALLPIVVWQWAWEKRKAALSMRGST